MSASRSKAARSVLWSAVENGGLALISFSSLVIYSRFLTASEFGLFSMALAVVDLCSVVVSMLFHDALVQKESVTDRHFDTAFTFTLGLGAVMVLGCWLGGPLFERITHEPRSALVLLGTALALPSTAMSSTIVARQRRELSFRTLAMRSLLGRVAGAVAGIVLVLLGAGLWGLVAQQVLIALSGSLVLWLSTNARPRLHFAFAEFKELIGFGAYAVGSLFLSFAISRLFTIFGGAQLGVEAAGYLNLSFRAVDVLWAIAAAAVGQVALPVLARLQAEPERLRRAFLEALELCCFILYPCFIGMAAISSEIVEVLFGKRWLSTTPYVTALALLVIVRAPRHLSRPLLIAVGRPRDALIGQIVEAITMLALLATIGAHTIAWAVAIWVLRELSAAPVMAWVVKRTTPIGYGDQVRGILPPLAAAGAMGIGVAFIARLIPAGHHVLVRLAILLPLGALLFAAMAWLICRRSLSRTLDLFSRALRKGRTDPAAIAS